MRANLLGVQMINFTNNDGEVINGTNISLRLLMKMLNVSADYHLTLEKQR